MLVSIFRFVPPRPRGSFPIPSFDHLTFCNNFCNSFGGQCFLGLEDILGPDDLFCDCSSATDSQGSSYSGKFCEHLLTYTDDEAAVVNPSLSVESKLDSSPESTGCSKNCQNGSVCKTGKPDSADKMAYDVYRRSSSEKIFEWCDCPVGFFGEMCEVPSAPCGGKVCFNNALCIEWKNATGHSNHQCSCQDDFGGEFCEFPATAHCPTPNNFEGDNFFCTNGGHCREEAYLGCLCPSGYHGLSCSYYTGTDDSSPVKSNSECDLQCSGRGTCAYGIKDLSYLDQATGAKHLNVSSNEDYKHCVCKNGFTGIQCEHEVAQCGGDTDHFCLHGSQCVQDEENGHHFCDCSTSSSNVSHAFAGKHCEFPATTICSNQTDGLMYCVNEGVCSESSSSGKYACQCPEGWDGPHCEIKLQKEEDVSREMLSIARFIFFVGLIVLAVTTVALASYRLDKGPRLLRARCVTSTRPISAMTMWPSNGGPNPDDNVNLSPTAEFHDNDYLTPFKDSPENWNPVTIPLPSQPPDMEADGGPVLFMGPDRDEDGNELANVNIL